MRSYYLPAARPTPRLLVILGMVLLALGGGVTAYPRWAEWHDQAQRQPARSPDDLPGALAAPVASAPAPPPDPRRRPVWISIPRIHVDASVTEVVKERGAYQVPAFDVGHHADSVNPGEVGNSVFNGHLATVDAGGVFAGLHQLAVGDSVQLYTPLDRSEWEVQEVRVVPASDSSFLEPAADSRLTLYTSAGSFDPRTHDYTHRLVVVGRLAQIVPRGT